jgi:hypothetical protein
MALNFPDSPLDGEGYEGFVYSSATGAWRLTKDPAKITTFVSYLVVGGGAGGRFGHGGGGGSGGFRTNFYGGYSGALQNIEDPFVPTLGTAYTVEIGAGGSQSANGADTTFASIVSKGGNQGGSYSYAIGGNGGGYDLGTPTSFAGGLPLGSGTSHSGGGGGGAGAVGNNATSQPRGGDGGVGLSSMIWGESVAHAGGGGGGGYNGNPGNGATGGGQGRSIGAGGGSAAGTNTGSGGGGGQGNGGSGYAGGSGIIYLRFPNVWAATFSAGLVYETKTIESDHLYKITSGSGTVTFNGN